METSVQHLIRYLAGKAARWRRREELRIEAARDQLESDEPAPEPTEAEESREDDLRQRYRDWASDQQHLR